MVVALLISVIGKIAEANGNPTIQNTNVVVIPATESYLMYFLFAFGLIISQLTSRIIKPQDQTFTEIISSQAVSLQKQIRIQLVYIYGLTCLIATGTCAIFALILLTQSDLDTRFVIPGLMSLLVVIVCFGSIGLVATLLLKSSVLGSLIGGIIVFALFLLMPPAQQDVSTYLYMFDFLDTFRNPLAWWLARLAYLFVGLAILIYCWRLLGRPEHLLDLSSASDMRHRLLPKAKRLKHPFLAVWNFLKHRQETFVIRLKNTTIAHLAYQVMVELRRGPLLLLNSGLTLMWLVTTLMYPVRGGRDAHAAAYHFLGQYFGTVSALYPFFLAWIAYDAFASRRKHQLDQAILAIIPPKKYLFISLIAQIIAALISFLVLSGVPFLLMLLLSFNFTPSFLFTHFAAYLAILIYGLTASTIYIAGVALLLGSIIPPRFEAAAQLIIAAVLWIAGVVVNQSIMGHLLVPNLNMAYRTTMYWLISAANLPLIVRDPPGPIVEATLLPLPLLSAVLQIMALWFIVSRVYVHQGRNG